MRERATFNITANVPWAITQKATDTWISSITPKTGSDNQQITIEYKANTEKMRRVAVLTLAATDVGGDTVNINLTQAGQVSVARQLSANTTNIPVNADAGRATFNVTATVPWAITQKVTDTWITSISPKTGSDNQQITIEYKANTEKMQRLAVLTLSATDGSETTGITLTQAAPSPALGLPTLAKNLRFYPNPASQTLYIEGISEETSLIIRTLAGKTLLRTSLRQNQAVDLSLPCRKGSIF